ncbi:MAG: Bax inhibitor-1/YccA family protein [Planctomycetota bacterium]
MLSSNPTLSESTFAGLGRRADVVTEDESMSIVGATNKTLFLLLLCVGTATFSWGAATSGASYTMGLLWGGAIGGLVVAFATVFKPDWSPITAPIYAVLEGLFLGAISAFYEASFGNQTAGGFPLDGIVVQAVGLTMGVAASMLLLYRFRVIRVTEKLRAGVLMATGAVMLFYLVSIGLGLFGVSMPLLHSSGPLGIGLSLLIVGIASFNLLLDFDLIERGAKAGAPKHMEWYAGFALLTTLVWLYLEILRLLAKLRR